MVNACFVMSFFCAAQKEAVRDLLVAQVSLKYTQSNSVGYCLDGQMIGPRLFPHFAVEAAERDFCLCLLATCTQALGQGL
jgi:hypothetical protein